jgi:hypothetical protein
MASSASETEYAGEVKIAGHVADFADRVGAIWTINDRFAIFGRHNFGTTQGRARRPP